MTVWSYTVGTVYGNMPKYFSGRNIVAADCYDETAKACLELSENYPFPSLQVTGPTVTLTINNPGPYPYADFQQPGDAGLEVNEFDSFFLYYNGPPVSGQQNVGYPLRFKTIVDLEILMNQIGTPTNWTRHDDNIYIAMAPNMLYYSYLRYQKEHPFPNRGTASAGTDPILLPNSWQDIVELCTAERLARNYDLEDRRVKYHNMVYGDPKFQASGGTLGAPGLIFQRTSQPQRDQETTTKMMRLMMRPLMR